MIERLIGVLITLVSLVHYVQTGNWKILPLTLIGVALIFARWAMAFAFFLLLDTVNDFFLTTWIASLFFPFTHDWEFAKWIARMLLGFTMALILRHEWKGLKPWKLFGGDKGEEGKRKEGRR